MRIRIHADGRILSGTPTQLVEQMHDLAFAAQHLSLSGYVAWAVQMAQDMLGVALEVGGDTDEALADSLVTAMLKAGLAEALDDQLVN